ncbi:hypothetical protein DLE54_10160 [Psychrobacter sp. YP14]|jgi:uncharacterized lipoprotein|uniref:Uncharacterized protein n=3 Tax=Psychrobacter TaxID=497 RepID=A0A844M292_9GAMM|nr:MULTISPECIES: hypothetical protein [Psychrobacter]AWT49830.1 hypothetical protein DLE54_10160 [Psychrobacter sp. YP14]MUG33071.1 hypothetical protein [Psychrobacter sanguinis]UNK05182.1 hypothetical protein MN210_14620 [Psychrobacter sp. PraFG1]
MHQTQLSKTSPKPVNAALSTAIQLLIVGASSLAILSGCQATKGVFGKVDDGSLAYQKAEKLDPIQLPADLEAGPFVPLYATPAVGVNTLDLENESGKRFELPPPYRQVLGQKSGDIESDSN